MNETPNRKPHRKLLIAAIVYALVVLFILIIANVDQINGWIGSILFLFRPIIAGLLLAYILNPVFRLYERRLFSRVHPMGLRRTFALILSYLTLLFVFAVLFMLIFPQLVASIGAFSEKYSGYLADAVQKYNGAVDWLNDLLARVNLEQSLFRPAVLEDVKQSLSEFFRDSGKLMDFFKRLVSKSAATSVINTISNIVTLVADILFGFFISLYLLATKEQRYAQIMKLRRALFGDRVNAAITRFCTVADRSFGSFLEGKIIDSAIIGVLTYVILLIFRIPYPILVAAIVGITNVVPVIGPIFGAIPTSVIILLTEPAKVIPFLIIVLIVQQIDGNIIGPKILGSSNGVSSLCVLIAITTMGSMWGLTGMILGVPLFATVLELLDNHLQDRLRARGMPSETENYYPADSMVDPAKDVESNTDKTLRNFERKVLHLRRMEEAGETLSRWNRLELRIYGLGRKLSLFPEISEETLTLFALEEAERNEEFAARQAAKKPD